MDNDIQANDFAELSPNEIVFDIAQARPAGATISATPYGWPQSSDIPPRPWIMEDWLLRGEVSAIIAPGGTGKSTFTNALALSLACGQPLLGKTIPQAPQGVWIFNLEDGPEELERQLAASAQAHGITKALCGDRLYLDSGLIQPLCMGHQIDNTPTINETDFQKLEETLVSNCISVLIVDPLVSSHQLAENSNEAIDLLIKRWKRLAINADCAVVLVHHTGKRNNMRTGAEDGRGASALHAAVRVVLTLNHLTDNEAANFNIDENERHQIIVVENGKANRGPCGRKTYFKIEGFDLKNGNFWSEGDSVGVARHWTPPKEAGLNTQSVAALQAAVVAGDYADSNQSSKWVGSAIAEAFELDLSSQKSLVTRLQKELVRKGYLAVERRMAGGRERPFTIVGSASPFTDTKNSHHLENLSEIGASSAGAPP